MNQMIFFLVILSSSTGNNEQPTDLAVCTAKGHEDDEDFAVVQNDRTRSNVHKQKYRKIHFHIIRNFCTVGMIKHTSTGCPESLLSLHPCRYLKSNWTQHWLMCCSRLGFEQSRLLCLQRCLPTSSVLCFLTKARFPECASVLTDANWSLCISFTERG